MRRRKGPKVGVRGPSDTTLGATGLHDLVRTTLPSLLLTAGVFTSISVHARLPDEELSLVGFGAESNLVLLRYSSSEGPPDAPPNVLELRVHALDTGARVTSYVVLGPKDRETGASREKLRRRRWRVAEAELRARGISVTSDAREMKTLARERGVFFRAELSELHTTLALVRSAEEPDTGDLLVSVDLEVEYAERRALARRRIGRIGNAHGAGVQRIYVDPSGEHVLLMSVIDGPRSGPIIVPMADVRHAIRRIERDARICPSLDLAYARLLSLPGAVPKGWKFDRHAAGPLGLIGPRASATRCRDGDSAAEFTCNEEKSRARFVVRLERVETFKCPPILQRATPCWEGGVPRFRSRCFFGFVASSPEICFRPPVLSARAMAPLFAETLDMVVVTATTAPACPE